MLTKWCPNSFSWAYILHFLKGREKDKIKQILDYVCLGWHVTRSLKPSLLIFIWVFTCSWDTFWETNLILFMFPRWWTHLSSWSGEETFWSKVFLAILFFTQNFEGGKLYNYSKNAVSKKDKGNKVKNIIYQILFSKNFLNFHFFFSSFNLTFSQKI